MTVLDQVRRLIERLAPAPICDECIGERLGLSARDQTAQAASELAGTGGFERRKDECAICGATRLVIGRNERSGP